MAPNGYNLTEGGEGNIPCDETRAKISAATSGENNPFFGKRHTAESLAKMSVSHQGNTAWVGRSHRRDSKAKISVVRRADSPFKNLIAEMDKRQMSYKELAELLGLPRPTLPEKMRGIKRFSAVEVIKLVKIFGLPAEYLLARDDGIPFSVCKDSPFKNLLIEMDKHKITYRKLAELLGFKNDATVSEKMSGKLNFTAEDIVKLVKIFGKPAEYLLERDDGLNGLSAIISAEEKSAKMSKEHRGNSPYKNLLAEMDKRKISYKELAELLGLARASFSFKMRGKQNFTAEQITKLVEIFGKPAEYLMARDAEG